MAEPLALPVIQIDLLLRYLVGQTTATEVEDVTRWLAARPEHAEALAILAQAFALTTPAAVPIPEASSTDAVWDRLAKRLPDADLEEARPLVLHRTAATPNGRSPFAPARARPWVRAAVALIAVGAGTGLWQLGTHWANASRQATSGYREYVTRPSERASFTLSDGTQVTLGVASRLRVPHDYGRTSRELRLDGEAYFEVHHDATRRFLVHSKHGITEDLGTRFDVRDYAGDTAVQVAVTEGKVALQATNAGRPAKPMVLTAGQLGYAMASGAVTVRGNADIAQHLAWLEGRLVLRGIPLRDALPQLSRWYDLDFQLGDSTLAAAGITAALTSQPIAGALDLLAITLGVRIEQDGRTVTLYPLTRS